MEWEVGSMDGGWVIWTGGINGTEDINRGRVMNEMKDMNGG